MLAIAAAILRKELASNEQWKFTGSKSMSLFQAPSKLASFVRLLLVGTKNKKVKGKYEEATIKSVDIVSQQIMLHYKTDRQKS